MQRNHPSRRRGFRRIAGVISCLIGIPQAASALPLLSEVFYDAVGSDNGTSFVEIHGTAGSSLDGFRIEAVNGANGEVTHVLDLAGVIPVGGLFVIADDDGTGGSLVLGADQIANFDFQHGPDSVRLLDATSAVVDALGYGSFGAGSFFAGEGTPATDAPAGSSLARRFADLDSDDNNGDWIVLASPTPGAAPLKPVPEPTAATLVGVGLAVLAGSRRGRRR
jgi:hypothetical protein